MPIVQWFVLCSCNSIFTSLLFGDEWHGWLCMLCFQVKILNFPFSFFSMRFIYNFWYILRTFFKHHLQSQCHCRDQIFLLHTLMNFVSQQETVYCLLGKAMVYYSMCFQYPEVYPPVYSISGLIFQQTCKDTASLIWPYSQIDPPSQLRSSS